jgi:ribosomal protein S27AE
MICPRCGRDRFACADCHYSEYGDDWMRSHHDLDTSAAKLDNIKEHNREIWEKMQAAGCYKDSSKALILGASVYRIPKLTYTYRLTFSRRSCPKCNSQDAHYMKKLKKLLCLECGTAWLVKIIRKERVQCERRVIRIPLAVYKARGNTFSRPPNERERRDSDVRSKRGYLSAHRIRVNR